jgi:tetratricopeptide (TPR) repeat protein
LADARDAFRQGAPPDSLAPVRAAIAALQAIGRGQPGSAEISRLLLQAAAAGAQSERDEMMLYLDAAIQMDTLQRAAGQPGAPVFSSLEVAGDLWLQVYRYADARRYYMQAFERGPETLRVLAGLARTAARLGDSQAACTEYLTLLEKWAGRDAEPPEITDARMYVSQPVCAR